MQKISHFIHRHSQSIFCTFALSGKKREFINATTGTGMKQSM